MIFNIHCFAFSGTILLALLDAICKTGITMKLTEKHKMMAVSAHASNQLRAWERCSCEQDNDEGQVRACLSCIAGDLNFAMWDEVYHCGMTIGQVVRWLDSL